MRPDKMTIMVYTKGVAGEGGGGRRVSMELLHNFNRLGHYCYSWSMLPLVPESLYGGRYRFSACHYYDSWEVDTARLDLAERKRICAAFADNLKARRPDCILFDTEHSFREFMILTEGVLDSSALPPLGVLVHDQLWMGNIAFLSAHSELSEAKTLEWDSPYPGLLSYTESVLARVRPALSRLGNQGAGGAAATDRSAAAPVWWPREHLVGKLRERLDLARRFLVGRIGQGLEQTAPQEMERIGSIKRDLKKASVLFCLTQRSAREAAAAYGMDRVVAASGFYDPRDMVTRSARSFRKECKTGNRKVLLAFSRVSAEKNIELILLAYSIALKKYPQMQLWIAGLVAAENKPYQQELMGFCQALGISESTFFLGTVTDDEMNGIYAESDAFICAQVADFNISVYYSLGFEKPVILFRCYDFPEILRNSAAVFCTNRDLVDMSRSIVAAFTSQTSMNDEEKQFVQSLTFENYARTVLDHLCAALPQSVAGQVRP